MSFDTELSPSATRIANVAQALLQQVGYNGFSFEHISQAVGMRKASVHHHFSSKVALGVAIVQRYTVQFEEALRQVDKQGVSAPQRLLAYADLFETTFRHEHQLCVCGMLGAEADSLDETIKSEVTRFFDMNLSWLTLAFQEGQTAGTLRSPHSAKALAETLLSLLEGAMLVGRSVSQPMGPRRACEVFLSGVTA
jgi:TetR/AcrR family transcriptional repressor of nem operon